MAGRSPRFSSSRTSDASVKCLGAFVRFRTAFTASTTNSPPSSTGGSNRSSSSCGGHAAYHPDRATTVPRARRLTPADSARTRVRRSPTSLICEASARRRTRS